MLINSTTTRKDTIGTSWISTTGKTWTHTSSGNIKITGGPDIDLNPVAIEVDEE